MTNNSRSSLYTGVTTGIETRVEQHRNGLGSTFTRKYRYEKLVYYEEFDDVTLAIAHGKQIKAGSRADKIALIKSMNPEWKGLSAEWRSPAKEIASSGRPDTANRNDEATGGRPSSQ